MFKSLTSYFDGFFDAVREMLPIAEYQLATKMAMEFGQYMDMTSAASPHNFHHVYEWGMVGQQDGRLFELTVTPNGRSATISYNFKPSIVPNENGVVFVDKAEVMESGDTVTFETDKPVPINDGESFRVGQFTFVPGGNGTSGAFREAFVLYFSSKTVAARISNIKITPSQLTRSGGERDARRLYDSISN